MQHPYPSQGEAEIDEKTVPKKRKAAKSSDGVKPKVMRDLIIKRLSLLAHILHSAARAKAKARKKTVQTMRTMKMTQQASATARVKARLRTRASTKQTIDTGIGAFIAYNFKNVRLRAWCNRAVN